MEGITPSQLERWANGRWLRGMLPSVIGKFQMDSRDVRGGDVFIALRTGKRDGHEFVRTASQSGASMAIVERPDMSVQLPQLVVDDTLDALHRIAAGQRRLFKNPLVAVTGSCGKTSTKELLALLLGENVLCTQGNLNNFIGMPLTLTRLDLATHRAAVVEVGISQKGEMAPLAQIVAPEWGVVTCVAPAHLAGLGSIEGVAEEKAGLLSCIGRDGHAFFPSACLQWLPFRELRARCLVTCDANGGVPVLPGANYGLVRYQTFHTAGSARSEMLLFMPGRENFLRFPLPRLSAGMQSNAALALAVAVELGVSEADLQKRVTAWTPARMRGEVRHEGKVDFYVDCYNANPASMLDAVHNFREEFPSVPRLYMMGCMNELGPESAILHEKLGEGIGAGGDERFCIVGTDGEAIRNGLVRAGVPGSKVIVAADRAQAHAVLDDFKKGRGAVFVKGSRSYQMEEFAPKSGDAKETH